MREGGKRFEAKTPEKSGKTSREMLTRPEMLVERVSLSSGIMSAVEELANRTEDFKSSTREGILSVEAQSGLSRHEIQEARSRSGVLAKVDSIFVRAEGLLQEFQSFMVTRFSRVSGESFFPKEELTAIQKSPREKKREMLLSYKEKLTTLRENLAILQDKMVDMIRRHPNASPKDYMKFVHAFAAKNGLHHSYVETAEKIIADYQKKHHAVEQAIERYPDPRRLYEAAFGRAPRGKVEIVKHPITLTIRCFDFQDYATGYLASHTPKKRASTDMAQLKTGIANLLRATKLSDQEWIVVIENAGRKQGYSRQRGIAPLELDKEIITHEEQHAIRQIFSEHATGLSLREGWEVFRTLYESGDLGINKKTQVLMEQYMRVFREFPEYKAADEILAYRKEGKDSTYIFRMLNAGKDIGGAYDFSVDKRRDLEDILVDLFAKRHEDGCPTVEEVQFVLDVSRKIFRDEYVNLMKDGLEAFDALVAHGFSTEQAIGFLINEPLAKWPKVTKRFLNEKRQGLKSVVVENTKVQ